eukprot:Phypoly_transcript_09365.p1 GENE.Phypoly_transcript_09365~~Phypoly_transcript_09365.p1  ORF type:complete len:340 (+),score=23.40 Phypoly_transcript_09365:290-1309(+)
MQIHGTPWHSALSMYTPGTLLCGVNAFLDIFTITGQYVCGALLCLSAFLMTVKQVELEKKRTCYWAFFCAAIFLPITISIPSLLVPTQNTPGGPCVIANKAVNIVLRMPYFLVLVLQLCLIIYTMKYIKRIYNAVKNNNSSNLPIKYIFVRFVATVIAQLINILPAQALFSFPNETYMHAIFTRFAIVTHSTGPMLDALVMIFGNPDVAQWIRQKISTHRLTKQSKKNTETTENETKGKNTEEGIDLAVISSSCELTDKDGSKTDLVFTLDISSNPSSSTTSTLDSPTSPLDSPTSALDSPTSVDKEIRQLTNLHSLQKWLPFSIPGRVLSKLAKFFRR